MMTGTFAWPTLDDFKDRILIIETSEDKPSPAYVGYTLRNYGIQGILQTIQGLIVAKPKAYSLKEKAELDREILGIAVGEFGCRKLNIVTNVDFGHTEPRHILPMGIKLRIDPTEEKLEFAEALFSD